MDHEIERAERGYLAPPEDDRGRGYCPRCYRTLSGMTVAETGFCEIHGRVYAERFRPEAFEDADADDGYDDSEEEG